MVVRQFTRLFRDTGVPACFSVFYYSTPCMEEILQHAQTSSSAVELLAGNSRGAQERVIKKAKRQFDFSR